MRNLVRSAGPPLLVILGLAIPVYVQAGDHEYVGSKKCRKCHIKEHKSWGQTKMAQAFELLKPGVRSEQKVAAGLDPEKDYTKDATCLPCHTTGYGKPGGFVDIEATPDHAGVGCEMCHGAGATYIQDQYMSLKNKNYKKDDIVAVGMVAQITGEQCMTVCHNTDSPFVGDDYVFDFEANKDKGTHKKFPLKYKH
ncbi:MAG: cytochrome c family protein [Acidobacteriota bacterium]